METDRNLAAFQAALLELAKAQATANTNKRAVEIHAAHTQPAAP